MNPERHTFLVKSKTAPTVELDMAAQAAYVRFKKGGATRTVARQAGSMHVAVDLDKNGDVLGIEVIGFDELRLDKLLATARVKAPGMNLGKARFRLTPSAA